MESLLRESIELPFDQGNPLGGLLAYDLGYRDSGISDPSLKRLIAEVLESMGDEKVELLVTKHVRYYLTDEKMAQGYGLSDALEFLKWFRDNFNYDFS